MSEAGPVGLLKIEPRPIVVPGRDGARVLDPQQVGEAMELLGAMTSGLEVSITARWRARQSAAEATTIQRVVSACAWCAGTSGCCARWWW